MGASRGKLRVSLGRLHLDVAARSIALQSAHAQPYGHAGCTGTQDSIQLTTLGSNGPNGPQSVSGYITSPPDPAAQLVQSGALAIAPAGSGVQRLTVPVTGTYCLDVNGEGSMLPSCLRSAYHARFSAMALAIGSLTIACRYATQRHPGEAAPPLPVLVLPHSCDGLHSFESCILS